MRLCPVFADPVTIVVKEQNAICYCTDNNKCVQDITFVVLTEYNGIVDGFCRFAIAVVGIVYNMTACSH